MLVTLKLENFFKNIEKNQISFTLYSEHSREGRGKLLLIHSVPRHCVLSGGIQCRTLPGYQSEEIKI